MSRRRLPVDPFEVGIDTLDASGAGRAEHEGRPLAVWGALPGERVRARHLLGRRLRGQAETVEVLRAAPARAVPRCPKFGTCSACSLQHLEPAAQLAYKQERLLELLASVGGVSPRQALEPLCADRWHYRRKARLSVRHVAKKGRVLVGFRERDGRFVTDMTECHTLDQRIADALPVLSGLVGAMDARSRIPQVEVSCGDHEAALVFRHLDALSEADRSRLADFEAGSALRVYLQPRGPDTVAPLSPGDSRLAYALPEENLRFAFEPLDFVQVNQGLNRRMVARAIELLAPGPGDRVLDLFCGLGNFTLPLARRGGTVIGLEGAETLVARAAANASANRIDNVRFHALDLYGGEIDARWPAGAFDAVLLDPPRSGAEPVLARIASTGARRVLYVSCNPETLARDAGALVRAHGYVLQCAGAMDMFPQTTHIEAMALFTLPPEGSDDGP